MPYSTLIAPFYSPAVRPCRLIDVCVGHEDRRIVLEVLDRHVERTGQADPRAPFKVSLLVLML